MGYFDFNLWDVGSSPTLSFKAKVAQLVEQ